MNHSITIQVPDSASLQKLEQFLKQYDPALTDKGPFRSYLTSDFPLYVNIDNFYKYIGWQTYHLGDETTWENTTYERKYLQGMPVDTLYNPELYPEYFI